MQAIHSKKSDKLQIIHHSAFEQLQNSNENTNECFRKIRNTKYKKKHQSNIDLLALIAAKRGQQKAKKSRSHFKKGATILKPTRTLKRRGKVREGSRKKLTRLKKFILRNRLLKSTPLLSSESTTECLNTPEIRNDEDRLHQSIFDTKNTSSSEESAQQLPSPATTLSPDYINSIESSTLTYNFSNLTLQESINSRNNAKNAPELSSEFSAPLKIALLDHIDSPKNSLIPDKLNNLALSNSAKGRKPVHSNRFREYCDNCTTPALATISRELLSVLDRFQKRAYSKSPIKANAHRRFVIGFREVQNQLRINKVKLVLIATDCEKCSVKGGIDDIIASIKTECNALGVPYAFPLQRRELAHVLKKHQIISCVGILDYDGAREIHAQFIKALEEAREKYSTII